MLYWSMVFLVMSIVAAAVGICGGSISVPVDLAWIAFTVCLSLFLICLIAGGVRVPEPAECGRHPVPGRQCQPPGPHERARGATGCIWCGKPIVQGE